MFLIHTDPLCAGRASYGYLDNLKLVSPPNSSRWRGGHGVVRLGKRVFPLLSTRGLDSVLRVLVGHDLLQGGDGSQDYLDERLVSRDNFGKPLRASHN